MTSSSTSHSAEPNPKITQKHKNLKQQNFPSLLPSPPKPNSHVVRTKATKCSKVVFKNSLPQSSTMQMQNNSEAEAETEPSTRVDAANEFLSFSGEEKEVSEDLLVDFNMGNDNGLSEFLNSDLSNMCNFSYNELLLSPCSDQPPMLSDEILKNWTQCCFNDETNVSNNFHSFNSFLDSSEEVLGE